MGSSRESTHTELSGCKKYLPSRPPFEMRTLDPVDEDGFPLDLARMSASPVIAASMFDVFLGATCTTGLLSNSFA